MTKGLSPVQGKVWDQEVSHTRLEHFLLLVLRTCPVRASFLKVMVLAGQMSKVDVSEPMAPLSVRRSYTHWPSAMGR